MNPQQQSLAAEIEEAVFAVIRAHQQVLPAAPTQELIDSPKVSTQVIPPTRAYPAVLAYIAREHYVPDGLVFDTQKQMHSIEPSLLAQAVKDWCRERGVLLRGVPTPRTLGNILYRIRKGEDQSRYKVNAVDACYRGGTVWIRPCQIDETLIPACLRSPTSLAYQLVS